MELIVDILYANSPLVMNPITQKNIFSGFEYGWISPYPIVVIVTMI